LPLWLILTVPEWNAHAMRSGADVAQPAVAVLVRSLSSRHKVLTRASAAILGRLR